MTAASAAGGLWTTRLAAAWLALVAAACAYLWLSGGWFHIELLHVSEYVRGRGLRTVFDWNVFDVNPARLRPLSDLLEVLDAMLRPRTAWLFGLHPSLSVSAIALAVFSAWFFFRAMTKMGLTRAESCVATALFISTIAYLSCFIPYIRPAKRLAMLGLCVLLDLAFSYRREKSDRTLAWLCGTLFLTFFADEAGWVLWPVFLLFLAPELDRRRIAAYFALPVAYLVVAKVLLPPIYGLLGGSGPRSGVIASSMVADRLASFLRPDFYAIAAENLGRTVAASFGTLTIPPAIPIAVLVAAFGVAVWRRQWVLLAALLSIVGQSFFFSMIDTVNTTPNYIGQWTYYYDTPVAVLSLVAAASAYLWLRRSHPRWGVVAGATVVLLCALNLKNFERANEVVRIIHTYPLAELKPRRFDPDGLAARFEVLLREGGYPYADAFRKQFAYYREHPMGDATYADRLEATYKKRLVAK